MRLKTKLMVMCVTAAVALVVGVVASAQNLHVTGQVQADTGPHWFLGNVGIGTNAPPGAKLEVAGDLRIATGQTAFRFAPEGDYLTLRDSTETADYWHLAVNRLTNDIGMSYNRVSIRGDSGNVGIGTVTPGAKLEVVGAVTQADGSLASAVLGSGFNHYTYFGAKTAGRIRGSNEGYLVVDSYPSGINNKLYLNLDSPGTVAIAAGGGYVGIGTTTPGEKLDVAGGIRSTAGLIYTTSEGGYGQTYLRTWGLSSAGDIYLEPAAGRNLILTDSWSQTGTLDIRFGTTVFSGGSVGIGTTTPGAKLHVAGATAQADGSLAAGILGNAWNHWTYFGGPTGGRIRGAPGDGYLVVDSHPSGTNNRLYLNLNSPGIVAIAAGGGDVGIGTTAPGAKLDVNGAIRASGGTAIYQCPDIHGEGCYENGSCVGQLSTATTCRANCAYSGGGGCNCFTTQACSLVGRLVAP